MKCKERKAIVLLISILAIPLLDQSAGEAAERLATVNLQEGARAEPQGRRIIEDPATHQCWILERYLNRPGAPSRLVQMPSGPPCVCHEEQVTRLLTKSERVAIPIIHAGDRLILTEHTAVSNVQLEAIALNGASVGQSLPVRLKIGGQILHAVATAPRRASIVSATVRTHP